MHSGHFHDKLNLDPDILVEMVFQQLPPSEVKALQKHIQNQIVGKNAAIQQSLQEDYMRLFSCQALLHKIGLFQEQLQQVTQEQHSCHLHSYQLLSQSMTPPPQEHPQEQMHHIDDQLDQVERLLDQFMVQESQEAIERLKGEAMGKDRVYLGQLEQNVATQVDYLLGHYSTLKHTLDRHKVLPQLHQYSTHTARHLFQDTIRLAPSFGESLSLLIDLVEVCPQNKEAIRLEFIKEFPWFSKQAQESPDDQFTSHLPTLHHFNQVMGLQGGHHDLVHSRAVFKKAQQIRAIQESVQAIECGVVLQEYSSLGHLLDTHSLAHLTSDEMLLQDYFPRLHLGLVTPFLQVQMPEEQGIAQDCLAKLDVIVSEVASQSHLFLLLLLHAHLLQLTPRFPLDPLLTRLQLRQTELIRGASESIKEQLVECNQCLCLLSPHFPEQTVQTLQTQVLSVHPGVDQSCLNNPLLFGRLFPCRDTIPTQVPPAQEEDQPVCQQQRAFKFYDFSLNSLGPKEKEDGPGKGKITSKDLQEMKNELTNNFKMGLQYIFSKKG